MIGVNPDVFVVWQSDIKTVNQDIEQTNPKENRCWHLDHIGLKRLLAACRASELEATACTAENLQVGNSFNLCSWKPPGWQQFSVQQIGFYRCDCAAETLQVGNSFQRSRLAFTDVIVQLKTSSLAKAFDAADWLFQLVQLKISRLATIFNAADWLLQICSA